MRTARRLPGEVLPFILLLLPHFAALRVEPEHVIAMFFHGQLNRRGFLNVDHVFDIFKRNRASRIQIEVGLQLPMARVGQDIEPELGLLTEAAFDHGILAVHGGTPEVLNGGDADERHLVELVLN